MATLASLEILTSLVNHQSIGTDSGTLVQTHAHPAVFLRVRPSCQVTLIRLAHVYVVLQQRLAAYASTLLQPFTHAHHALSLSLVILA